MYPYLPTGSENSVFCRTVKKLNLEGVERKERGRGVTTMSDSTTQQQMGGGGGSGGTGALFEYLCSIFQTRDLANVDPIAHFGPKAYARSRTRTIAIPIAFEGSAAAFDGIVKDGGHIRMTVAQMLDGNVKRLLPHVQRAKDADQGVTVNMYNPENAFINNISLADPLNTLPQGVGIVTNGLPSAYAKLREEQTEDLIKELGVKPRNTNIIAHIPSNTEPGAKPDAKQIPVLKEVINGYHGVEVTRTFGGITSQHLWRGIIPLEPALAQKLGLSAPPPEHDAEKAPLGFEQAYNSWAIVPAGHLLSHISNLPASDIKRSGYEVHQLALPGNIKIPFLLMDLWTIQRYAKATVANAIIKIDGDRCSVPDTYIELAPLGGDTWLNSCMAGQHFQRGRVSFKLLITYTMFPSTFRTDGRLVAALSDGFPRMSMDMRAMMDTTSSLDNVGTKKKHHADEKEDGEDMEVDDDAKGKEEEEQPPMPQQQQYPQASNRSVWGE